MAHDCHFGTPLADASEIRYICNRKSKEFAIRNQMNRNLPIYRLYHIILTALLLLSAGMVHAESSLLFSRIKLGEGRGHNEIRSLARLDDGRMVVVTPDEIGLFDGAGFNTWPLFPEKLHGRLRGYTGHTHIFIDSDSLLWTKHLGNVSCFDLRHERHLKVDSMLRTLFPKTNGNIEDLFVDKNGKPWARTGASITDGSVRVKISAGSGELQDLDCDGKRLYLFFSSGNMKVHDKVSGEKLYNSAAYPKSKANKYSATSLVVTDSRNNYYQLRTGSKGGFFRFRTATREWDIILETDYRLNTLSIAGDTTAHVSCPRGIWEIDLRDGRKRHYSHVRTDQGNMLATEISTILIESEGGTWLGTLNRGLLYAHPDEYTHQVIAVAPEINAEQLRRGCFMENRNGEIIFGTA